MTVILNQCYKGDVPKQECLEDEPGDNDGRREEEEEPMRKAKRYAFDIFISYQLLGMLVMV